ncbi:uncharacterized protein LOC106171524 [Lingula anatina]|uniref:chitin synthase n=1 Tax=Lingula anatina TaxID=7574 RepID=A0A1S3JAZ1_LINAN|nr:uncharacterized protein LOC106171524 [Lingula anatina]|eukprot:XP_013407366.1 uncharacterized protein LOC106171524 [Lingula anatina]
MASERSDSLTLPVTEQNAVAGGQEVQFRSTAKVQSFQNSADADTPDATYDEHLTVGKKSKVEAELNARLLYSQRPSKALTILKWLVTFVMFACVTAAIVASKLSAVYIARAVNETFQDANSTGFNLGKINPSYPRRKDVAPTVPSQHSDGNKLRQEVAFLMVILTTMFPYLVTLVVAVWVGSFRRDMPWPSGLAVFWGIVGSILEVTGLLLLCLITMRNYNPIVAVFLMNGVFFIPIITSLVKSFRRLETTNKIHFFAFLFAFFMEVGGMVTSMFQGYTDVHVPERLSWETPIAMLFLSLAWCPLIQKAQLYPQRSAHVEFEMSRNMTRSTIALRQSGVRMQAANHSLSPDGSYIDDQDIQASPHTASMRSGEFGASTVNIDDLIDVMPNSSARWKQSILTSIWKLVLTPCIALAFAALADIHYDPDVLSTLFTFIGQYKGFDINTWHSNLVIYFILNITCSFLGYILSLFACMMCMQKYAFALPLLLSTPCAVAFLAIRTYLGKNTHDARVIDFEKSLYWQVPAGVALFLAQILSTGVFIFRHQIVVMEKEPFLFWLPGYNATLLEQWLQLSRKTTQSMYRYEAPLERAKRTRVYICTTMYREADYEMEQFLRSLECINRAQAGLDRHFEAHIFFDAAVRDKKASDFLLQLVSLVETVLDSPTIEATRLMTPYGMSMSWQLRAPPGKRGMALTIHLKDNFKVKNKKRWSQVMYMSYVMDFLMKANDDMSDHETFILTTDADVKFSTDSVEALLDNMVRDNNVGAVCARTHPMGSGPLVWYQTFDYAIGHWFQKAANDVLGTVLCCPGCFSVYRVAALRDVLPLYSSKVTKADEFLTKDMGEDRWLCTLMVQAGWRLEYSAAAEDSTHCPEDFDEFFKQRRRWIPSTLANQFLILKDWLLVTKFNDQVRMYFALYQALLVVSTLLGPGTVILIVAGGLNYSLCLNFNWMVVLLLLITIAYAMVCLLTTQETQLLVGKILTFVFALIMAAVSVGTAVQIGEDIGRATHAVNLTEYKHCGKTIPVNLANSIIPLSTTTLYFAAIVGMFLLAGLMHLFEVMALFQGLWYLLCLPSGYLLLMVYSVCNITDRSWGTREEKKDTPNVMTSSVPWRTKIATFWKGYLCCCFYRKTEQQIDVERRSSLPVETLDPDQVSVSTGHHSTMTKDTYRESATPRQEDEDSSDYEITGEELMYQRSSHGRQKSSTYRSRAKSIHSSYNDTREGLVLVENWLEGDLKKYASRLRRQGFDDTRFLADMTEKELKACGVEVKAHRKAIIEDIKQLPHPEIETFVPIDSWEWLQYLGMDQYYPHFKKNRIVHRKDFEILKGMSQEEIRNDLGVRKPGHLKFLLKAIKNLRWPTEQEIRLQETRKKFDDLPLYYLHEIKADENEFWNKLRKKCLLPNSKAFGTEEELKDKLVELRNFYLILFAVINALWLIFILLLANEKVLFVLGTNPLGLAFLVVFGIVLVIQFLAMIVHRIATWMHMIARAPYVFGKPFQTTWGFHQGDTLSGSVNLDYWVTEEARAKYRQKAERQISKRRHTYSRKGKSSKKPEVTGNSKKSINKSDRESMEPLLKEEGRSVGRSFIT